MTRKKRDITLKPRVYLLVAGLTVAATPHHWDRSMHRPRLFLLL